MPTSPLMAAMLGGNDNNAMLGLDPSLLNASQDVQTGQNIENQALSTAPAPPGAALARALVAVPGAYVKQQATSNLTKALSGGIEAAKNIFDETTPIVKGLRSDNPLV